MTTQQMLSPFRRAITDFNLIEAGDRVAVGLSGGKDSLTLLCLLAAFRRFSPQPFELYAFTVDMGLGFLEEEVAALRAWCGELEVPLRIERTDIGQILFEIRREKNPCSLCSKLRRGALNGLARSAGCNKLALGHHRDDAVESLLMSMIFNSAISSMPARLEMFDGELTLIRPLIYLSNEETVCYAGIRRFREQVKHCPYERATNRGSVRELLRRVEELSPNARANIFAAMRNIRPDYLP